MSELSHLTWQCRRGTKELDLVLTYYLVQFYQTAHNNEQHAFQQLLALEDPILSDLLLGTSTIDDHNQQSLIKKLRRLINTHVQNT